VEVVEEKSERGIVYSDHSMRDARAFDVMRYGKMAGLSVEWQRGGEQMWADVNALGL
jgi:hypothetical protein